MWQVFENVIEFSQTQFVFQILEAGFEELQSLVCDVHLFLNFILHFLAHFLFQLGHALLELLVLILQFLDLALLGITLDSWAVAGVDIIVQVVFSEDSGFAFGAVNMGVRTSLLDVLHVQFHILKAKVTKLARSQAWAATFEVFL